MFCQLEVGKSKLQKVRILIAEKGAKPLIGRGWLNVFNYQFVSPNQKAGSNATYKVTTKNSLQMKVNKLIEAGKQTEVTNHNNKNEQIKLKNQFEELFERQRKLIGHVKVEFKRNEMVTQQKGKKSTYTTIRSCRRRN